MTTEYTAYFPFGGLGAGALGFISSRVRIGAETATVRSLGGFDCDSLACEDFEQLTGSPSLCVRVEDLTPEELRKHAGEKAPDIIFASPPCKGASRLLRRVHVRRDKYVAMNELALVWLRLMLGTWDKPPRLVLIENVPLLRGRAGDMVGTLTQLLRGAGYAVTEGFHDCGEIGGLAQRRRRWLLVARHMGSTDALLYEPPKRRVRGCGEVLGTLPTPGSPEGGPLHALPRLSWASWNRLALIPPGGDWRDCPGVLREGQARREVFRRYLLADWAKPSDTIAGGGTNGPYGVCDPRIPRTPEQAVAARDGAPKLAPVIATADGTWHRPFTTLELAALQGIPTRVAAGPLTLAGSTSSARGRIGNAVPPPAAQAIADQMLTTLLSGDTGGFALSGASGVWAERDYAGAVRCSHSKNREVAIEHWNRASQ